MKSLAWPWPNRTEEDLTTLGLRTLWVDSVLLGDSGMSVTLRALGTLNLSGRQKLLKDSASPAGSPDQEDSKP